MFDFIHQAPFLPFRWFDNLHVPIRLLSMGLYGQELQSGKDDKIGLKGMKAVRPYMKEIIVSDGE